MFVADALGAWLVGLLADAGRRRLTRLVLGSDQERALRQAATVAIESTAAELAPSGGGRAGELAMVVSEVFREPLAGAALAGQATLLEALLVATVVLRHGLVAAIFAFAAQARDALAGGPPW